MTFRLRRRQSHRRICLTTSNIKRLIRHRRHQRHQVNRHTSTQRNSRLPIRFAPLLSIFTNTSRSTTTNISQKIRKLKHHQTNMRSILITRIRRVLNNHMRTIFIISASKNIRSISKQHISTSSQRTSTLRLFSLFLISNRKHRRRHISITSR